MSALGRHVERLDLELYRDSPFIDYVQFPGLTSAVVYFPTLDPAVQWDAAIAGTRGDFYQTADEVNAIPEVASDGGLVRWELWLNRAAVASGFVVRRGGNSGLPSPGDPVDRPLYPSSTIYPMGA